MNIKSWFDLKLGENNYLLYTIILFGFLLRVLRIGNQSLWNDEVTTFLQTNSNSIKEVYLTVLGEEGHIGPLYHILNFLFTSIFGYKEWALRFPSAVYNSISVIFVYLIAKRLFETRIGLFSSFIYAISPIQIYYAQEARMYSLWVMLMLIWFYQFLIFQKKPNLKNTIILTLFAVLNIWTYLNSLFVFFAVGIYLLFKWRMHSKSLVLFLVTIIIAFLSYIPGIIYFFSNNSEDVINKIGSKRLVSIFDFSYAFHTFNVGFSIGPSLEEIRAFVLSSPGINKINFLITHGVILVPIELFYGILFAYSFIYFIKQKISNLLFITLVIPFFIIVIITYILDLTPFNIRYILNLQPFYIIFLCAGIFYITRFSNKIRNSVKIIIILISLFSISNYYFSKKYAKLDFRSVVQYFENNMKEGDKAIILHEYSDVWLKYYDPSNMLVKYYIPLDGNGINIAQRIINASKNRIFYIKSSRTQNYSEEILLKINKLLKDEFSESQKIDGFVSIDMIVYDNKRDEYK